MLFSFLKLRGNDDAFKDTVHLMPLCISMMAQKTKTADKHRVWSKDGQADAVKQWCPLVYRNVIAVGSF